MLSKINTLDAGYMSTMGIFSGMPFIVVDRNFMPLFRTLENFFNSNMESPSMNVAHEGYLITKNGQLSKMVFSMDLSNLKEDNDCRELSSSEISEFLECSELPRVLQDTGSIKGWHLNDVMFLIDAERINQLLGV